MLLTALTTAEKRKWVNFWTGNEPWIKVRIDEELPHKMRQTITAIKSMLTVFFNPKEFVIANLLPQGMSFIAPYLVINVSIPLANRHAQQRGGTVCRKLHLQFYNSKCQASRYVKEQMASHHCIHVLHPIFTRFGHRKLLPVRVVKATTLWENPGQ
jgi:hypothetical protein